MMIMKMTMIRWAVTKSLSFDGCFISVCVGEYIIRSKNLVGDDSALYHTYRPLAKRGSAYRAHNNVITRSATDSLYGKQICKHILNLIHLHS